MSLKKAFSAFAVAGLMSLTVISTSAMAIGVDSQNYDTPPGGVSVKVAKANGSGCRKNTTAVALSGDNASMTMTFSDYAARIGPGILSGEFQKDCEMALTIDVPAGWEFGVTKTVFRGYSDLSNGAKGFLNAGYRFTGGKAAFLKWDPLVGPRNDNFQFSNENSPNDIVWSSCGKSRDFNVSTKLKVEKGTSDPKKDFSSMSMESADFETAIGFDFAWRKC